MADLLVFVAAGATETGPIPPGTDHCRLPTNVEHEVHMGISRLRIGSIDRDVAGELLIGGQAETTSVGLAQPDVDVNLYGSLALPNAAWDQSLLKFTVGGNTWYFWVDSLGDLRFVLGAPTGEFTGEVVGSRDVSTFVFRPGGVKKENVYTDWDELYTRIQETQGPLTVQVDTSLGAAVISGGSAPYDLSRVRLVGRDVDQGVTSILGVAALLSRMPIVGAGVALTNQDVAPVYVSSGGDIVLVDERGGIFGNASAPLIDVNAGAMTLIAKGQIGSPANAAVVITAGATMDVLAREGCLSQDGGVDSDVGATMNLNFLSAAAVFGDGGTHAGFQGTANIIRGEISNLVAYDNAVSGLLADNVKDAIDLLAAAAGGSSKWDDPGAYIEPLATPGKAVAIGVSGGPVAGEKLRVGSALAASAIIAEGHVQIDDDSSGGYAGDAGDWDGPHLILGDYHVWVDSLAVTRIKNGAPASEFDGSPIGGGGGGSGYLFVDVSGQVDGVTDTFTIPNYQPGQVYVWRNGIMEDPAGINEVSATQVQLPVVPDNVDPEPVVIGYLPV